MAEKRRFKRRHLIYYLRVFFRKNDQLIGHLVDITTKGIKLIREEPIETNASFPLKMILPKEIQRTRQKAFDAESMWCKKDINPDFYITGLKLINVSQKDIQIIKRLILDFSMDQ